MLSKNIIIRKEDTSLPQMALKQGLGGLNYNVHKNLFKKLNIVSVYNIEYYNLFQLLPFHASHPQLNH